MLLAKAYSRSWQEDSRLATVLALVEQGTFVIDDTAFNRAGDKVFIAGHFYSDKMPILSVAAAGVYSIVRHVFGLALDSPLCAPKKDVAACRAYTPTGTRFTVFYWLTLILIGGSSSLLVVLFWHALLKAGATGPLATAAAVGLGLASPVVPYSTVFAGFYLLEGALRVQDHQASGSSGALVQSNVGILQRSVPSRFLGAGLLIGLAANIDLALALFVAAFAVWILISRREQLLAFLGGALAPFVVTSLLTYWAAGRVTPLYLDPAAYDYPGSALKPSAGGTTGFYSLEFGAQYAYNLLIGRRGVFAFTPLLIFAGIGMATVIRTNAAGLRGLTIAMAGGSVAFVLYLILRTDNYGGVAWGIRWLVPLIPLWWYYLYEAYATVRTRRFADLSLLLFWSLMLLSFLAVLPGLQDAWNTARPIIQL